MKKYATLFSILAVIVAIHVLVFISCIYSEKNSSPGKEKTGTEQKTSESEEKSVAADPQPVAPEQPDPGAAAVITQTTPPPIPAPGRNYGRPFIYQYAVMGNITALPESKDATSGILVDLDTHTVLWAKNHRKGFPIASMTKIMTCLLAYEDIAAGKVTLETPVKVSVAASRIGGSQVYLDPRETFTMHELLKATSIKSANDAAYQIGEFLGNGNISTFIRRMNTRAAELKMPDTHFYNPNGSPGNTSQTDNIASPEGMARLAEETLRHPFLIQLATTWLDSFRTPGSKGYVQLKNHNYLLPASRSPEAAVGVDGLKTGFIRRSGYCVTATCLRDNHRLVAVVTGFPFRKDRDRFVKELLDWGYERVANPAAALKKDPKAPAAKAVAPAKKTPPKKVPAKKQTTPQRSKS